jgi:hypothetical protein
MVRARRLIAGADDYADKALRPWAVIARPLRQRWPRSIAEVLVWLLLATAMAGPRERLVQSLHGVMQSVHAVNIMVVLDTSADMYLRRSPAPLAVEARSDLLTLQQLLRGERLGLVVYGRASGEIVPPTDDPALFDYYLDHVGPDLALTTWRPDVAAAIPWDSGLAGALYLARHALRRMPGRSDAILLIAGTAPCAFWRGRPAAGWSRGRTAGRRSIETASPASNPTGHRSMRNRPGTICSPGR